MQQLLDRGASIVLGFFSIPGAYRDAVGLVDVADFAAFWIALLQYLKDQGIDMPQYLASAMCLILSAVGAFACFRQLAGPRSKKRDRGRNLTPPP